MLRWKLAIAAGVIVLAVAGSARAQGPSPGSTGMQFVPINTTQNLAAPIPVRIMPQRKSLLKRVHDSVSKLSPFSPSQPTMPVATTQPKGTSAAAGLSNLIPPKPKVTDFVSGAAK